MKISILGGGGFLGRKVAARLARDGKLGGQPITGLTLFDLAEPPKPAAAFPVTAVAGDIVELPEAAIPPDTDVIFHLAAVVSAQAEADYDLGRRVNLRGTDAVVDACRRLVAAGASRRASYSPRPWQPSPGDRTPACRTMPVRCRPTAMGHKRPRPS